MREEFTAKPFSERRISQTVPLTAPRSDTTAETKQGSDLGRRTMTETGKKERLLPRVCHGTHPHAATYTHTHTHAHTHTHMPDIAAPQR